MRFRLALALLFCGSTSSPLLAESPYQLAQRVGASIGIGSGGACSSCHATSSEQTLLRWQEGWNRVSACLSSGSTQEKMACILQRSDIENFSLRPSQIGFYAAGLLQPEFQDLLKAVYGDEKAKAITIDLQQKTAMPYRAAPLSAEAYADLSAWLEMGMPYLNELLEPYDGPTSCTEGLDPSIKEHLLRTARDSWQTRNAERDMPMFACSPGGGCFQQQRNGQPLFPERDAWRTSAGDHLQQLMEFPATTYYWTRSSADGRFVAYGGSPSAIVDLQSSLQNPAAPRVIPVDAYYDPAFFPDDSAFVFQGRRTGICNMSLLKDPSTRAISFREEACTANQTSEIPLYQSIGASLDGSDYLAATGAFVSDQGNGDGPEFDRILRRAPLQTLDADNALYLFPVRYDGQRWITGEAQSFQTPYEEDWALAPSNRLLLSRLAPKLRPLSYQFYELSRPAAEAGGATQPYATKLLGSLCLKGSKANFSFDDRFMVTYGYIEADHHSLLGYASVDDPAFQALLRGGTANIFLFDLWTQKTVAVTRMGIDQYALFPHFRSDGWLYFMVFDRASGKRSLLASDAALKTARAAPITGGGRSGF